MPEERRHNDGRRNDDGHCGAHDDQTKAITSMKTERKVLAGVAVLVIGLVSYVYNDNTSKISADLREIKAFMSAAAINDSLQKSKVEQIEWRLSRLEEAVKK